MWSPDGIALGGDTLVSGFACYVQAMARMKDVDFVFWKFLQI